MAEEVSIRIVDRQQRGRAGLQDVEQRGDLADALAGEPIELPDDDNVDRSAPEVFEESLVARPAGAAAVAGLPVGVHGETVNPLIAHSARQSAS